VPKFSVLVTTFPSISSGASNRLLTFAVNRGHVFEAGKRPIFLWGLDINFYELAQVENDVATDGPSGGSVATSFNRE
jgi:hypothetical protein